MEIVENELRFFDKSGKLKFSLPFRDIQSMTPKPAMNFGAPDSDADFTTEILIQLKSGEAFTLFLTDSGYAQIEGKFKALPILDTKKIPLYMHILFYACIIAVGFSAILSNQVLSFFYGFLLSLDTL